MATSIKNRPIPLLAPYHGRSKRAKENREWLAEKAEVDEKTVLRWVRGDESPPDDVIIELLGPCGPHGSRIAYQLGWLDVPGSEIPERWRAVVAADTVARMEYVLPGDCERLLSVLEERLAADVPDELPEDSPDVRYAGGALPKIHSSVELQRLRQALLAFMAEPLDEATVDEVAA